MVARWIVKDLGWWHGEWSRRTGQYELGKFIPRLHPTYLKSSEGRTTVNMQDAKVFGNSHHHEVLLKAYREHPEQYEVIPVLIVQLPPEYSHAVTAAEPRHA